MIQIIKIPSVGRGRPLNKKMKDTKWIANDDGENDATADREQNARVEAQGEISWRSRVPENSAPRYESERYVVGSSIAEISKSKEGDGQGSQSRRAMRQERATSTF